jgi:hypothetical protein
MDTNKSLDEIELIAALLHDVQTSHGVVFNTRACELTCKKVRKRCSKEGISFLTKTLPKLGKALDKALSFSSSLNSVELGFKSQLGSKLPIFMGEFFNKVLSPSGDSLPNPCAECIIVLRQVLYLFYKYKLPYTDEQEQLVLSQFEKTEQELVAVATTLAGLAGNISNTNGSRRTRSKAPIPDAVVREARILLSNLFDDGRWFFDPRDIYPRHGPGVVSTRERLWGKYRWTCIPARITDMYPYDAYFHASLGHVCDSYRSFNTVDDKELSAKVILVQKDSRGPRLISCEPLAFQWVQQGLGRAISQHVEHCPLTKWNVFFTDQLPNKRGALLGSKTGRYATLDLKEASDRVSVDLVRLLFPERIHTYLEACRSLSTVLPNGKVLPLRKFAPMGSALCFPIMALTIWAILTAAAPDADTRESILVYGDDVIVPTAYAENAIEHLESFGLLVNRDKSCIRGFFRESCGTDAFKGIDVTPLRIRTVWSSSPSPDSYASWIAYANSCWERKYYITYDYIVGWLERVYRSIPGKDLGILPNLSLYMVPDSLKPKRFRTNRHLQKREWLVWDVKPVKLQKRIDGWSMLLRWFAEGQKHSHGSDSGHNGGDVSAPFSVSTGLGKPNVALAMGG